LWSICKINVSKDFFFTDLKCNKAFTFGKVLRFQKDTHIYCGDLKFSEKNARLEATTRGALVFGELLIPIATLHQLAKTNENFFVST